MTTSESRDCAVTDTIESYTNCVLSNRYRDLVLEYHPQSNNEKKIRKKESLKEKKKER